MGADIVVPSGVEGTAAEGSGHARSVDGGGEAAVRGGGHRVLLAVTRARARAHGGVAVLLHRLRELARRAVEDPADGPGARLHGLRRGGRRERHGSEGGRPGHRPGHVGVQRLLLLLHRPPGPVLGDVRPRRHLARRRGALQRRRRQRRGQRRRLLGDDERHRQPGVGDRVRSARRGGSAAWAAASRRAWAPSSTSPRSSRARASRSSASATSASGWSRPRRSRAPARSSPSTRSPTAASSPARSVRPTSSTRAPRTRSPPSRA